MFSKLFSSFLNNSTASSKKVQWRNYGRQWRQPPQGASPEGAPRDQCQKKILTPTVLLCNHVVTINKILNFAENNVNNVDIICLSQW